MTLIGLIIALVIIGIIMGMVPMDVRIRNIIYVLVVLGVLAVVLALLGVHVPYLSNFAAH